MNKINILIVFGFLCISCSTKSKILRSDVTKHSESISYTNYNGEPIRKLTGVSSLEKTYKNSLLTSVKYYGAKNDPVELKERYYKKNFEWRYKYDVHGNLISQTAHDIQGELMNISSRRFPAITEYSYNDNNQVIKRTNYDENMKLEGIGEDKIAITKYKYNSQGQLVEVTNLTSNNEQIKSGSGHVEYQYNRRGNMVESKSYFADGTLKNIYTRSYEKGRIVRTQLNTAGGSLLNSNKYTYKGDRVVKKEFWSSIINDTIVNEEKFKLQLDGWGLNEKYRDISQIGISGKGDYEIEVSDTGRIIQMEALTSSCNCPEFNSAVYNYFKNIVLDESKEVKSYAGVIKIVLLDQNISSENYKKKIVKPEPFY